MMKMKKKKEEQEKQPMKYWLVEFELTSGEILQFYVGAINQFEAYQKADGYRFFVNNKTLRSKLKFGLLP